MEDFYFTNLFLNNNFIKSNTKLKYIKNIENIMKLYFNNKTIMFVMQNPKTLYKCIKNEKTSIHTKSFKMTVFFLIFEYDKNFKNDNVEMFFEWKKYMNKIKKPVEDFYLSNFP
jgi:hypothetical protein